MSNALAIAGVTAMLRHLIGRTLDDHDVATAIAGASVSAGPPDRVPVSGGSDEESRLNLFLYQVTPNLGWRNVGVPSRDGTGQSLDNPPLALDLHYLLTAYGAEELDAEVLLGFGMQVLHEMPVLTRDALRAALRPPALAPGDPPGVLPDRFRRLPPIDLAEQVEQVKISPEAMGSEEMSRLWSAFQARYRPTAAYRLSVVLIQSRRSVPDALPVRRRTVLAVPAGQPSIEEVVAAGGRTEPVLVGTTLVLRGRSLQRPSTRVRVGSDLVEPAVVSDREVRLTLSAPPLSPGTLRAGISAVQVEQALMLGDPPVEHRGFESNLVPFVLRPVITARAAPLVPPVAGGADLTVTFSPPVRAGQRVVLLLNEEVGAAAEGYSVEVPVAAVDQATIVVGVRGVRPSMYLVRARVDGASSLPRLDAASDPDVPRVAIA